MVLLVLAEGLSRHVPRFHVRLYFYTHLFSFCVCAVFVFSMRYASISILNYCCSLIDPHLLFLTY
jgi:hypothetical protein